MSRLIYYKNLTKSYFNQNKLYGGASLDVNGNGGEAISKQIQSISEGEII